MEEFSETLDRWHLTLGQVRDYIYDAANRRERERWHALWLVGLGWTQAEVARSLGRDAHTIGGWLETFRADGPAAVTFEQTGGSPPPWTPTAKLS